MEAHALPTQYGVQHGSIFGPLLLVLYINDVKTVCSKTTFLPSTDDTIMISPGGLVGTEIQPKLMRGRIYSPK